MFQKYQKGKGTFCAAGDSDNKRTERTPHKLFRYGYEDHLIAKCSKQPNENEKRRKQVFLNEKGNCACENGQNNSDQKIYASMARMSGIEKYPSGNFGVSSQLTNWILDYGATCHMTPDVSDLISGSLEDTDKHIEVTDGHHVTAKQKGKVRIKMCDNNEYNFIATLQNVLLAPDLCDKLC